MIKYNDSELLYLVYEGESVATDILIKKYVGLIYRRVNGFKIKNKNFEDFIQEGLMALNDAINTYVPIYNKTFTKYFDLILQRRIITILRKDSKYFYNVTLVEDFYGEVQEQGFCYNDEVYDFEFNELEKEVFKLKFLRNYKPNEISTLLNCDLKKVYNTIYIIKEKIRKFLF